MGKVKVSKVKQLEALVCVIKYAIFAGFSASHGPSNVFSLETTGVLANMYPDECSNFAFKRFEFQNATPPTKSF